MKIAWVFPGQGSQKPGMASEVRNLPNTNERFEFASNLFGRDLYKICEDKSNDRGSQFDLNNTINTQICLFLVESILLDAFKNSANQPDFIAGHSLGEITALYAADVLSFEKCVSLIKIRSELMANAEDGSMAAVIGFDRDELNNLINKFDDVVIANDNSSLQVVLSGSKAALADVSRQINCKRFLNLNVSGAFHSHFMREPSERFIKYLNTLDFSPATFPVISNSNPSMSQDPNELKQRLKDQMCNGVRWRETMDLMNDSKDQLHLIEIGPSNVLGGLSKRHLKDVMISQIATSESLALIK